MKEQEINSAIKQFGITYRGKIIDDVIYLERNIDEFLTRYFSKEEKRTEVFEMIFGNRMNWRAKLDLLSAILKLHYLDFIQKHPYFLIDLEDLSKERNIVAHCLLNTSKDGRKAYVERQEIGFVRFKDMTKDEWRNLTKLDEFNIKYNRCFVALFELIK